MAPIHGRFPTQLWDHAVAIIHAKAQIKEAAYALLQKAEQHAQQICDSFLDDRAQHLLDTRQIPKELALRQLIWAEHQSSIFKHLGIWLKRGEHFNLDRLLTPDDPLDLPNTTWSTIIDAQALFEALTDDGQKHFHQAADTPFVSGPIAEILSPFADNGYSDAILNGTFDLSTLDEMVEVHDIIKGMHYPHPTAPTPPIDITILNEQTNKPQRLKYLSYFVPTVDFIVAQPMVGLSTSCHFRDVLITKCAKVTPAWIQSRRTHPSISTQPPQTGAGEK
jgi:hypothetical protein